MACSANSCFNAVQGFFKRHFEAYGRLLGRHPIPFMVLALALCLLGIGLIRIESESDIETLYTPVNSRASKDRTTTVSLFGKGTEDNFFAYAATQEAPYGELILQSSTNILTGTPLTDVRAIIDDMKSLNVTKDGTITTFSDICAKRNGQCIIDGEFITETSFLNAYSNRIVTYPEWNTTAALVDVSTFLGDAQTSSGILDAAKVLKLTFHLRQDTDDQAELSRLWEEVFLAHVSNKELTTVNIFYDTSASLGKELDSNTAGDITYFSITFSLMIFYATIIAGGDHVSSRTWVSWSGVLSEGLGILAAFGLISACGVKFVNIVGVMPFLVLGIGVDDMFLLMAAWVKARKDKITGVPETMGATFREAGIGITITSITDLLAFAIGASSVFRSVSNFSIYTGVAVIFSYFFQITFFTGCLALHTRRVNEKRNCCCCCCIKHPQWSGAQEKGWPAIFCGEERVCEIYPRKAISAVVKPKVGKVVIGILFLGYLAASIYGATQLKQGLSLKNLVSPSSYYYKHNEVNEQNFGETFPIPFVVSEIQNYRTASVSNAFEDLLKSGEGDKDVKSGSKICWLTSYTASTFFDNSGDAAFMAGLNTFLVNNPQFNLDIVQDSSLQSVLASRCYLFSSPNLDSNAQANVMDRMRNLADDSSLPVYVYHPAFIYFEQYLAILSATLQSVGIALAVMFVVTCIFIPHPVMVFIVVLNVISILVGIFGFMHYWDLTLSSITMIHLIMCVGFSVDYSVHVITHYMLAEPDHDYESLRGQKMDKAIEGAAGPILNGGFSSFIGIVVLAASTSYIFLSFFKVMFLVVVFGVAHAVLFLPVFLSLVGPTSSYEIHDMPDVPMQDTKT